MSAKRVPEDWAPTSDLLAWTRSKCPLVNAAEFLEEFRDIEFYRGHTDWPATWRNLCRKRQRELERYNKPPPWELRGNGRGGYVPVVSTPESPLAAEARLQNAIRGLAEVKRLKNG